MRLIAYALTAVTLLGACSTDGLRNLQSRGNGPDQFAIVPAKPLETPDSLTALPQPTPGGFNRTGQRPLEDGIAALGGQATSPNAAVPGRDAALVNHTSRFGREANIRGTLAESDAALRKRQGRLSSVRIFKQDEYALIYRRQALDPNEAARAYQRAGIPIPSTPPEPRRQR